ncbi:MAG: helix-turn-helix domain-containing protein [Geobacteraceae bacterium]|nr:helix-turn-helix domain-containing protein [Geobacteraceae bacterium]
MPPKKTSEHVQTSSAKKDAVRTMMDDAPLFAGLDDFVLLQTQRKEAKPQKTVPARQKKKTVPRRKQTATVTEPPPQAVPKTRKAAPNETSAVLLSVKEMCSLLKISRATLIRMDKAGKLPGRIKLGGSVRFHRETVETWLQSLISSHPA